VFISGWCVSKRDVVQSHVEALCERMLGTTDLKVNPQGEIPIRYGTAVYTVRVVPTQRGPHAEVCAIAVDDVDADPGLYEALNEVNRMASHFHAFWIDHKVVFASEFLGETLSVEEFECACEEIASAAHHEGLRLTKVYGGHVAYPEGSLDDEDEEDA